MNLQVRITQSPLVSLNPCIIHFLQFLIPCPSRVCHYCLVPYECGMNNRRTVHDYVRATY
jgi:hypothetical protein